MSPNDAIAPVLPPGHASLPADELLVIANEYVEAGRLDAGERLAGHVLRALPHAGQALQLLGLIAFRRGRHADAASFIERGIAAGSVNHTQWRNLSEIYRTQVRLDEALAAARRAIALDPADPLNFFNLSMVQFDRLELEGAVSAARAALDLNPKLPEAHMKLAQILLTQGAFAEGWREYEWRYQIPGAAPLMPATDKPQWDGTKPDGKLLLIGDQGYGDVIQFMRYMPWVRSIADDIVIASSQELAGIVAQAAPGIPQFHRWEDIPPFAAYCALSGLPRLHGTTLETIPQGVPYLQADPALAAAWKAKLDARLPAGLVLAELDLGPFILAETQDTVLAAPYHRMAWGIWAAHEAQDAAPEAAEAKVRALNVTYMVECAGNPLRVGPNSFEASLRAGKVPGWLETLSPSGQTLQIYRVRAPASPTSAPLTSHPFRLL